MAETSAQPGPFPLDGLWRCDECGEAAVLDARWRWNGKAWQHHHPYPAGHVSCTYFGPDKHGEVRNEHPGEVAERYARNWAAVLRSPAAIAVLRDGGTPDAEALCMTKHRESADWTYDKDLPAAVPPAEPAREPLPLRKESTDAEAPSTGRPITVDESDGPAPSLDPRYMDPAPPPPDVDSANRKAPPPK